MKQKIKLIIEYDGTDFVGWQRQPNGLSVQEEIETKLAKIIREPVVLVGAGRTDSGVHARGQAAHFLTASTMAPNEIRRSLNGFLREDVVIHSAERVDDSFSARYSAKTREYRYYISRKPSAIERRFSWIVGYPLETAKMNRCADSIRGEHDFQSFCKSDSSAQQFRCEVFSSVWAEDDGLLVYTIRANRFLYGMVRALVGTMVDIGRGHTAEEEFSEILSSKNRARAGQAAPPHGLFLERVTY